MACVGNAAHSGIAVDLFGVNNVGVGGIFFDTFASLLAFLAASIALSTVGDDVAVCVDKPPSPLIRAVDEEFKGCCHSMVLSHTHMILPVIEAIFQPLVLSTRRRQRFRPVVASHAQA